MNQNRRKFLRFLLIGSGVLVLGKIFGSKLFLSSGSESFLNKKQQLASGRKTLSLGEFKIVNSGNRLKFLNRKGKKVFTLHEDGTLEIGS
jgi:hypothetical protein